MRKWTPNCARSSSQLPHAVQFFVLAAVFLAFFLGNPVAGAGTTRTQPIALTTGWNAIWLEVSPADDQVAAVFDPEKVDVVARYFTPETQVRFIEDPGEKAWNAPGWGVWYAPSRAEAFLTSLHAIHGNCAYLVHATTACTLNVTGEVRFRPLRWNTDSYNLTGLPVSETVKPTFARFFSGADGRVGGQIYRLVEGSWQKVGNPAAQQIRAGEAYWIYCEGKTNYQGPLELRFAGSDRLSLGAGSNRSVIEYANRATNAFAVSASIESAENLPLFRSIPDLANFSAESKPFMGEMTLRNLAAGGVSQFRLEFRPALMTGTAGSALLKLSTSDGVVLRVPVRVTLP
jgi:hypothetical protein